MSVKISQTFFQILKLVKTVKRINVEFYISAVILNNNNNKNLERQFDGVPLQDRMQSRVGLLQWSYIPTG